MQAISGDLPKNIAFIVFVRYTLVLFGERGKGKGERGKGKKQYFMVLRMALDCST
jgi:hypothetical protein